MLVNCAGTGNAIKTASRDKSTGAIKSFPTADFDRIIQINLVGTFRCIAKSAAGMMTLPALEDGERGAIVNTASVAAQDGQIGQASYSASKAGIVGMTLPIARDLMGEGIRVNTILPGIFDTPLLARAARPREERAGGVGAVPQAAGPPRRIRRAGRVHDHHGLFQRRMRAAGWCHPHGAALTSGPERRAIIEATIQGCLRMDNDESSRPPGEDFHCRNIRGIRFALADSKTVSGPDGCVAASARALGEPARRVGSTIAR